jgi:hypothetical protein
MKRKKENKRGKLVVFSVEVLGHVFPLGRLEIGDLLVDELRGREAGLVQKGRWNGGERNELCSSRRR